MNSRLLGILCMVGGAAMVAGALIWGEFANTPGIIAGIIWSLGSIAGLVGLIQLGALGDSPLSRALGFVPIIGFALLAVGSVLQLARHLRRPELHLRRRLDRADGGHVDRRHPHYCRQELAGMASVCTAAVDSGNPGRSGPWRSPR